MKETLPYLTFPGNCRDAMQFYAGVLGGELNLMRAGDTGQCAPGDENLIMHGSLRYPGGGLMASDALSHLPGQLVPGNNFSLSVDCSSAEEQQKMFDGLSEGADITMPLQETFWGARFGMLKDRFGIQWMFNFDKGQAHA